MTNNLLFINLFIYKTVRKIFFSIRNNKNKPEKNGINIRHKPHISRILGAWELLVRKKYGHLSFGNECI